MNSENRLDRVDISLLLKQENFPLLQGIEFTSKLTGDQWEWIEAAEEDFQLVRRSLLLYFSGKEVIYPDNPSQKRWLRNLLKYYTQLYWLIQACWKPLQNTQLTDLKEQLGLRKDLDPGDLLCLLLRLQFLNLVHECLVPYFELNISEQRRFFNNLGAYPDLTPQKNRELDVKKRQFLRDSGRFQLPLLVTLKTISAQARKFGKDSELSQELNRFVTHVGTMRQASIKRLRSRKPYHWKSGDLHVGA